jgi:hypothetical protein
MAARLTYSVTRHGGEYIARCLELPVESSGSSAEAAVDALKRTLERQMTSEEAVAPPSRPPPASHVELVAVAEPRQEPDGPGDSPAAEET